MVLLKMMYEEVSEQIHPFKTVLPCRIKRQKLIVW